MLLIPCKRSIRLEAPVRLTLFSERAKRKPGLIIFFHPRIMTSPANSPSAKPWLGQRRCRKILFLKIGRASCRERVLDAAVAVFMIIRGHVFIRGRYGCDSEKPMSGGLTRSGRVKV